MRITRQYLPGVFGGMAVLLLLSVALPGCLESGGTTDTVGDISALQDDFDASDYTWEGSSVSYITLNGSSISEDAAGVSASGSVLTISSPGTYEIQGSLSDGRIIVDTGSDDNGVVRIILAGVNITCLDSAPFYVAHAERVALILADGAINVLTDASTYTYFDNQADSEPNAALFSKDYLTIGAPASGSGTGQLTVNGNYNDGIAGKDGLIVYGGKITVNAVDDGIRGKDYLIVKDGELTVTTGQGDGLKSDNADDAEKGYVSIDGGTVRITSGGDAVQAETFVLAYDGSVTIESGGGAGTAFDAANDSRKGLKGTDGVLIKGGTFAIDSADDAIHSNNFVEMDGGVLDIYAGDDGIHADTKVDVYGGDISIWKSYEGIEGKTVSIHDGSIHVESTDDGINCSDGSGDTAPVTPGAGMPQTTASDCYLYLYGGYLAVYAQGDGLDSNGSIEMTGGTALVHGPTGSDNGSLDCGDVGGAISVNGGLLIGAGSAGMAVAPGSSSSQYSKLLTFDRKSAGTLVHIQSSDGSSNIATFAPSKQYESIVISSPGLKAGVTYNVYFGGTYTGGTKSDGLCEGGTYSGGTRDTRLSFSL